MARPRRNPAAATPTPTRSADGLWHAYVLMGLKPDGSRDRKHVRRADRTELLKAVRDLERSRDLGVYRWTEDDPTLQVWVDHWLTAILPMSARRKTIDTYVSQLTKHLLPTLGHMKLSALRPEHFEELYASLAELVARHSESLGPAG